MTRTEAPEPAGLHRLLERELEIAAVDAAIEPARAGTGTLILIEGPAGIGKTTVLRVYGEHARNAGFRVLAARGGSLERDLAWAAVRELFSAAVDARHEEAFEGAASLAQAPLGRGSRRQGSSDAIASGLHGLYWLTANLTESGPLLVIVDDAHAVDAASVRFLTYLSARIADLPAVVALALRGDDPLASDEPVLSLRALPEAQVVVPRPLSENASVDFLTATFAKPIDREFANACHAVTGGNPYLLKELATHLRHEGVAPTAESAPAVGEATPDSVRRSVLLRLARLSDHARSLAAALSILGVGASLDHAAEVAELDRSSAGEAADALAAADIIARARPLEFLHPIVRAAVGAELSESERAVRHERAARLLVRDGAAPEAVAAHLLATDPAGEEWVVMALRRAADGALAEGAPMTAVDYLSRALAEPPSPDSRPVILHRLGAAETSVGDERGIEHLREAVAAAPDRDQAAHYSLELGRALAAAGRAVEAWDVMTRAIGWIEEGDRDLAARLEAELFEAADLELQTRTRAIERLARLRRRTPEGDSPGERLVLARLAMEAAFGEGPAARAVKLARRALAGGTLIAENPDSQAPLIAADALVLTDLPDAALAIYDDAVAGARGRGSRLAMAFAMAWRAAAHRRAGRLVEAEGDVRETLAAFRDAGDLPVAPALLGTLAEILLERGEPEAAVKAFAAAEVPDSPPETIPGTRLLHSRAQLRIANGELRGGVEDLLEVGRRLQAWGFSGPAWLAWRSSAGSALVALGETERGDALIDEEVRGARSFGAPRPLGMALRAAGVCQDENRAIDLLNDAVAVLVDSADRLEHARALVDLGAALRRSRRRGAAISRLREGLDLASRCGARALAERARSELRVAGARPRRDALRGSDALTASELRVARMAAAGMANKRIAQDLFVSLRTVETHLTHVYGKLGIASRTELPPALAGAGNAAGSSAAEVR